MDVFTSQEFIRLTIMKTFLPDHINDRLEIKNNSEPISSSDAKPESPDKKDPENHDDNSSSNPWNAKTD